MSIRMHESSILGAPSTGPACQVLFCLKERNRKLIDSYFWALQAFSPALNPKVCVFLNAGTEPKKDSIYHL